jgi:chromosome segregation ATPase
MAELTKQEIKSVFIEALEPFAFSIQQELQRIDGRLDGIDKRLNNIEADMVDVKYRLSNVEQNQIELNNKFDSLIITIDSLIYAHKKQEQEVIMFSIQIKRLEERLIKVEQRLTQ